MIFKQIPREIYKEKLITDGNWEGQEETLKKIPKKVKNEEKQVELRRWFR